MATKATKRYLFPADYMADPSVHVFDGKIYIYPSHDWEASNVENDNGDQYIMKDYHVLSIDGDPMTGTVTDHGCVLRQEDIPWAGRQLWDCDVQEYLVEVPTNAEEQAAGLGFSKKVKKYIMYFPLKDRNDVFHWGTAIADNPAGPFILCVKRFIVCAPAVSARNSSSSRYSCVLRSPCCGVTSPISMAVSCTSPSMAAALAKDSLPVPDESEEREEL